MIMAAIAAVVLMVVAAGIRIIIQRSGSKRLCRFISRSLYAGIKLDPGICQSHLCAHADAAANQSINFGGIQKSCQCAIAAAVGVNNLFSCDFSVLNVIQLELLGMSEMLENLSVFISDGDSHCVDFFLHYCLIEFDRRKFTATACNQQPLPVDERVSDLFLALS